MSEYFEETEDYSGTLPHFSRIEKNSITVCNTGTAALSAWSAGRVGMLLHSDPEGRADLFAVSPAVDEEEPWGILPNTLAPGEVGELVMTGIVPAHIVQNGTGTRVCATEDGLQRAYRGRGELLVFAETDNAPSTILLGTLCGTQYNGCFKLVPTGTGVKIINGRNPSSNICGYTDLPGSPYVAATELANYSGAIYLHVSHDSAGYHTSFGVYDSTDPMQILIGSVDRLFVEQNMLEDTAYFGRRFFL